MDLQTKNAQIYFFNRYTQKVEEEKIYGNFFLNLLYETKAGRAISPLLTKKFLSKAYGALQNRPLSKKKIRPFIKKFHINMDEFLPEEGKNEADPYSTFNSFFIRKFKEGKRIFPEEKSAFPAFAEGRYLGFKKITDELTFPIKGKELSAEKVLANSKWDTTFKAGPAYLARLCPVDYHRFHFPDDGKVLDFYKINGGLHSVNPVAIKKKVDIYSTNERHVTIMETPQFGKLAYIEIGAICVGKIIQSHPESRPFKKGDEKGYFLFGGSSVLLLGEKNAWTPSEDILKNTDQKMETYIRLGDKIGNVQFKEKLQ